MCMGVRARFSYAYFGRTVQDAVTGGAWLPSGRSFVTVSEDGSLIEWSPKKQEIIMKVDSMSSSGVPALGHHISC